MSIQSTEENSSVIADLHELSQTVVRQREALTASFDTLTMLDKVIRAAEFTAEQMERRR